MPDTLYENNTNVSSGLIGSSFGAWWRSQTITPSITHQITSVDLNGIRIGNPGMFTVEIYGVDGGGDPDVGGGVLASGSYDGDTISDVANEWVNITVSGASPVLTASTQYAIVWYLQNDGLGGSHTIGWHGKSSGSVYAGGVHARNTNGGVGSWTKFTTQDFGFREYGVIPPITKTFTAGASISKDDVTKTFTADANLVEPKKTLTADASIGQVDLTKTVTADAHIDAIPDLTWPPSRAPAYDEDNFWDEETKAWYAPDSAIGTARSSQAGGRHRNQIVVMSEQGRIFFGAL